MPYQTTNLSASGLLFSDAPEITGLANLPLGLAVGPVYQPIDVSWIDCYGMEEGKFN